MKQVFAFIVCLLFISQGSGQRYIINDSVLIHTSYGITLSAVVVRSADVQTKQPAALMFFIYANTARSIQEAKSAADHGYVGIVADARGKRLGTGKIEPYEHEVQDVNAVIEWITHQPWSDGRVGMYGGSYSGFAQWAATKKLHKALKTIVPYVAAIPGLGVPMENNIFLTANYQWPFYVTTSNMLDTAINNDFQRFRKLRVNWFYSGVPFNRIDSIDGLPNPWLQKWLKHPSFDRYWQSMIPFRNEYAHINIPVLSITGYYDDGQVSAMEYFREHYRYRPDAEHYLVIGPYDHFGAQQGGRKVLRGYTVDSVALINTRELTFQWFDHILKGKEKPSLIKDKINFQQMGTNTWKHAPSLKKMEDSIVTFYLADNKMLSRTKPSKTTYHKQEIDLANRDQWTNQYYPDPIIETSIDTTSGLFFWTDTFNEDITVSGQIEGVLKAIINKRDMDIGLTLYEVMPDETFFHLTYYIGRASYAKDMTTRRLLTPGKLASIPISRSRLFSKKVQKGSRLLLVLNINKNPFSEVNYGSGKIVNTESIKDAGKPLSIQWSNESFIQLGISSLKK
nr:CocE/NonD family hydrolase [uncultured Sediminibacterium sp.]